MSLTKPKYVLLIYKKSIYHIYFVDKHPSKNGLEGITDADMARWKVAHKQHLHVLEQVKKELKDRGIKFRDVYRARQVSYEPFDMVIAIGGDGTFIEASRRIGTQPILGVNSDPERSVGHYCSTTIDTFAADFDNYCNGQVLPLPLNRLSLKLDGTPLEMTAINDLLIAHHRPAAFSKYIITIDDVSEEHSGSGIWISTAMGATGAVVPAGGQQMSPRSPDLQYRPRELYLGNGRHYTLTGGILAANKKLQITSGMREGEISLDGCRCRIPFGYGRKLEISNAKDPVNLITGMDESPSVAPENT